MAMWTAAVSVAGIFGVVGSSDPNDANLDPAEAVLSFLAADGIDLAAIEGPVADWTSPLSLSALIIRSATLVAFVGWE